MPSGFAWMVRYVGWVQVQVLKQVLLPEYATKCWRMQATMCERGHGHDQTPKRRYEREAWIVDLDERGMWSTCRGLKRQGSASSCRWERKVKR